MILHLCCNNSPRFALNLTYQNKRDVNMPFCVLFNYWYAITNTKTVADTTNFAKAENCSLVTKERR